MADASSPDQPTPAGQARRAWQPVEPVTCRCGVARRQPWHTRDALYSPASFFGGVAWILVDTVAFLGGFETFAWILFGVLSSIVAGALVQQLVKRHRGFCWLGRGIWFGIALPGIPLRALGLLNF